MPVTFENQMLALMTSMGGQLADNTSATKSLVTRLQVVEDISKQTLSNPGGVDLSASSSSSSLGGVAGVTIHHGTHKEKANIIGTGLPVDPSKSKYLMVKLMETCKQIITASHMSDKLDGN